MLHISKFLFKHKIICILIFNMYQNSYEIKTDMSAVNKTKNKHKYIISFITSKLQLYTN